MSVTSEDVEFANSASRSRLLNAVSYTMHVHADDFRVTGVPALSHLLAVAAMVMENHGNEDEVIAALLHDAAEDCGGEARIGEILKLYGTEVARIVRGCSDSLAPRKEDRPPWAERKRAYVAHLRDMDASVWLVVVADKLHNSRAMFREARVGSGSFWQRIGRGPEKTLAYFHAVHEVLEDIYPCHLTSELGLMVAQLTASYCNPAELRNEIRSFRKVE
jgi:(p)ppGpp synthase/HD superfamily hydrolase